VPVQSTIGIVDAPMAFEQPTALQRPAGDVPDAVVDGRETNIFADAGNRDVAPAPIPAEAASGADRPHLTAVRRRQGRPFRRPGAWRGCRAGRRRLPVKRFVRPLRVARLTAAMEAWRWARRWAAGGRVVSALRGRGRRS
jgi:hypothetical protein